MTTQMIPTLPPDAILGELLPGERIEWAGRPNPSVILHPEDWLAIPFSLLWGGFAVFWLLGASGIWGFWSNRPDRAFQWFGVVWGTPFVLVGQYMIWGRFLYSRWRKQRTYYALTNRRAIIFQSSFGGRSSASAYFERLPMIDKRVRSNGAGDISFGGPIAGEWQWGRNNSPRPLTFEDLDDVNSAYGIAIRLNDQARKP
jgi:hypothetical protein